MWRHRIVNAPPLYVGSKAPLAGFETEEAVVSAGKNRDFASLLDELIAAAPADEAEAARPHVSVDYLSVADELHSGRIKVSADAVAAEYRLADAAAEAASEALFAAVTEPLVDELPSIEPDAISRELGLTGNVPPTELGARRRAFAFKNHPDRVAPHLRQRAMVRMQVANMLIDEAKKATRRVR
jgi:hypothetical protein